MVLLLFRWRCVMMDVFALSLVDTYRSFFSESVPVLLHPRCRRRLLLYLRPFVHTPERRL
jgi:hypothetical protein